MNAAKIIPFDFEENAVRVIMRDDEPWFVAVDICRVLEIQNTSDALKRLDDDEIDMVNLNTLDTTEGIRGNPNARVISESGLYALIFTSRKEQARRFRKWVTSDVLPSIRTTGRYEHVLPEPENSLSPGDSSARDAELWLSMIREARLLGGTKAGCSMWARSTLPPLVPSVVSHITEHEGRACLAHLLGRIAGAIAVARDGRTDEGANALTDSGVRARGDGLFVANYALPVFENTNWAGGTHRGALLALNGVFAPSGGLTIGGLSTRGLIVPWALIDGEVL